MTADKPFEIGSVPLTLDVLEEVARRFRPVALASDASFRVALSREVVEFLRDRGEKVYGQIGRASCRERV